MRTGEALSGCRRSDILENFAVGGGGAAPSRHSGAGACRAGTVPSRHSASRHLSRRAKQHLGKCAEQAPK